MIDSLVSKATALLTSVVLFFTGLFAAPQELGVQLPSGTATFETSLASGITADASSLTLSANSVRGGGTLSGYECFTIDEGSAQAEFVCGQVSGTTVSSLERGIDPSDGVSTTTALAFSHRRGSSVKITDFPLIQRLKRQNSGESTFASTISYASGVTPTGLDDLADVGYVLSAITGTSSIQTDRVAVPGTAGETFATGTPIYFKPSDQRWYKVTTADTSTYFDREIGIAQGPGTAASSINGGVVVRGIDSNQSGLTPGSTYFVTTAGALTTATTAIPIGVARSATQLYVNKNVVTSAIGTPTTFSATTTFTGPVIGISSTTIRVFTASTTYTKPTNLKHIVLEMVGAGGGGGGQDSGGTTEGAAGGGGGGGYCKRLISASQLNATTSVIVGALVAGGTATGGNGLTGSSSVFVGFATSTGGVGGNGQNGTGGAGGTSTGCDLSIPGQPGMAGAGDLELTSGRFSTPMGGVTPLGTYGAGGAGAFSSNGAQTAGDASTQGVVIITEYF